MVAEFHKFLSSQIDKFKKDGKNNIVKDDGFEKLREEKEVLVWASYITLFSFYKFTPNGEGKGTFKDQLLGKSYKVLEAFEALGKSIEALDNSVTRALFVIDGQNYNHIENFERFISQKYDPPR